jgi:predicted DNA-binding transcriptional regulator AlpA
MTDQHDAFDTERAAQRLGLSISTLEKMRCLGGGPAYLKLGRRVVYEVADLDAWKAARRTLSTSQRAA